MSEQTETPAFIPPQPLQFLNPTEQIIFKYILSKVQENGSFEYEGRLPNDSTYKPATDNVCARLQQYDIVSHLFSGGIYVVAFSKLKSYDDSFEEDRLRGAINQRIEITQRGTPFVYDRYIYSDLRQYLERKRGYLIKDNYSTTKDYTCTISHVNDADSTVQESVDF